MDEEIRKILDDHERRIRVIEGQDDLKMKITKKESINEFIISKKPSNDVEKTAVCAYFLEHIRGNGSFTTNDIEKLFKEAKKSAPENISDKIAKCHKKGWMMKNDNEKSKNKAYVMTKKGEKAVEDGFGKAKEK